MYEIDLRVAWKTWAQLWAEVDVPPYRFSKGVWVETGEGLKVVLSSDCGGQFAFDIYGREPGNRKLGSWSCVEEYQEYPGTLEAPVCVATLTPRSPSRSCADRCLCLQTHLLESVSPDRVSLSCAAGCSKPALLWGASPKLGTVKVSLPWPRTFVVPPFVAISTFIVDRNRESVHESNLVQNFSIARKTSMFGTDGVSSLFALR